MRIPDLRENVRSLVGTNVPVLQQLALVAVILLLIFGAALTPAVFMREGETTPAPIQQVQQMARSQPVTESGQAESDTFAEVAITAQSAYVWDIAKQRALYKKNEAEQLPLASLTKLMTALVAHELLAAEEKITITEAAVRQDGLSMLRPGEVFDRLSLSDLTLISSSNDGAYALAYSAGAVLSQDDPANAFVQAMNIRAKEIGLSQTYFKNPSGLDLSETEGGAVGTARDMAFLMEYIIENAPSILSYTQDAQTNITSESGFLHETANTNYFVDAIPGLIGSKTGFTDLAGGNLTVAFEAGLNRPIVIVVMGSTRQDRFSDVIALSDETRRYLRQQ